jgi:deazaflavin-dependent oxidoreductase (nitroreductase family)
MTSATAEPRSTKDGRIVPVSDQNARVIEEFRAAGGRRGGEPPLVLVHHRGRRTGRGLVSPMRCLPHETDGDVIYVIASAGGGPRHPGWYHNLISAGTAVVERGGESCPVTVRELTGEERDQRYAEMARLLPSFADYARTTTGVRTVPVLELTRSDARHQN